MKTTLPYTWVVRYDVAALYVADGFTFSDQRALEMLSRETTGCMSTEIAARVLVAPDRVRILKEQGARPDAKGRETIVEKELRIGSPAAYNQGTLLDALVSAWALLDSVPFVSKEGDTEEVRSKLKGAIGMLQGTAPISTIHWEEVQP